MTIQNVLDRIKRDFDTTIETAKFNGKPYGNNGHKAKTALIRSQRVINYIHEFIKEEFVKCGVPPKTIYPPIGQSKPEIAIEGFLKSKKQDISIIYDHRLLPKSKKKLIDPNNEKIITVNIRSQLSSLKKNIDTLYERTFAEAMNLHLICPKQCLGEVYLIPTHEYDDKAMIDKQIRFKSPSNIEDYIRKFQAINNRVIPNHNEYSYERVCLLIVNFKPSTPKLYNSVQELQADNLIPKNTDVSMKNLTLDGFAQDLLDVYSKRFKSTTSS